MLVPYEIDLDKTVCVVCGTTLMRSYSTILTYKDWGSIKFQACSISPYLNCLLKLKTDATPCKQFAILTPIQLILRDFKTMPNRSTAGLMVSTWLMGIKPNKLFSSITA